jgi:hypothetical protein
MFLMSAGSHADPAVLTLGWKWAAVGIAAAFIAFLYVVVSLLARNWNPLNIARGTDGPLSTSKFQWLLWLVAVLFVYTALLVIRFKQNNYHAINTIPINVLIVLGFSTATAVAAKGITVAQVQTGQVDKSQDAGGLFLGDQNYPDIAKTQMLAFTFVAIGIFIATFVHQLNVNPPVTTLPNIDASLLVLMGISQGGYVGKKLVTTSTTVLYGVNPTEGNPGDSVGLTGSNFGSSQDGSQVTLDGGVVQDPGITWSDQSIGFKVPVRDVARDKDWGVAQDVSVRVVVNGQSTNPMTFTVNPPVLSNPTPQQAAKGDSVEIPGHNLGDAPGQLSINGAKIQKDVHWTNAAITFKVPDINPADNEPWQANQAISIEAVVNGHPSNKVSFTVTS